VIEGNEDGQLVAESLCLGWTAGQLVPREFYESSCPALVDKPLIGERWQLRSTWTRFSGLGGLGLKCDSGKEKTPSNKE
jgi:hypothetical protein